jgi:site-specific DNA-methyltransferase (adenine-specific)
MNTLYYGDNLPILCEYIKDESIDLIYLDPPFNSNRSYNVLFKDESGSSSDAQIAAFDDTWHWGPSAEAIYDELLTCCKPEVGTMISALRQFIGENQMMAYLVMMAARLVELHRVLKSTGSLYLHCDSTASHYLNIILDTIFGPDRFLSKIIWQRTATHNDAKRWPSLSDEILFYSKNNQFTWHPQFRQQTDTDIEKRYRFTDPDGRRFRLGPIDSPNPRPNMIYDWKGYKPPLKGWRYSKETMAELDALGLIWYPEDKNKRLARKLYLDESKGALLGNIWTDIPPLQASAAERLGYPTQKPLALLERIIQASSSPGDLVLDPFSGCGTAISAAQKLGRQWIGIDITYLAIAMHKNRLKDMFNLDPGKDYRVIGEPVDHADAHQLAHDDRYQFQWWALSMIQAMPLGGQKGKKEGKKGSDRGIDGVINFIDDPKGKLSQVLVQVKSGNVNSGLIRDLRGVIERDNAALGVFITLEPPTSEMKKEAVSAGFYTSTIYGQKYPRLQILCIEDLLKGDKVKMPPTANTFKKAERVKKVQGEQTAIDFDEKGAEE